MSTIEAVIVTWNSGETIGRCLERVCTSANTARTSACATVGVTVVDNASTDNTLERVRNYQNVYLIANSDNRGFAAAVNQGIARTGAEYILLINPDVELLGSVDPLVEALSAAGIVVTAGRLEQANGAAQAGFTVRRLPSALTLAYEVLGLNRVFPWNPVNRRYRYRDLPLDRDADVEQPAGAFLMFRREFWREVGGFDERFFPVWFEDVDFCKRALERGRIRYVAAVAARHQGGVSIARMDWSNREIHWYGSLLWYASKHFSPFDFRLVCGAVVLGSAMRSVPAVFSRRTLKAITVFAKIAGLAARYLLVGRASAPAHVEEHRQGGSVRTITSSRN